MKFLTFSTSASYTIGAEQYEGIAKDVRLFSNVPYTSPVVYSK